MLLTPCRTVVALVLALALGACGSGGGTTTATTLPPNVVPEQASAWTTITVRATASGREARAPDDLKPRVAPLLTGRLLRTVEALSSYGLDSPQATVTYAGRDTTRVVHVGKATFDGHGYYVQREGDRRVFLVPADQIQPLLALVGLGR